MSSLNASEHNGSLASGNQQPLSLMTINLNPSRRDDQLIIRILEASERKKQLIKKLLTPEEFESINFDQYDYDTNQRGRVQSSGLNLAWEDKQQITQQDNLERIGTDQQSNDWRASSDLQSCLARKREALEFFFRDESEAPQAKQDNLAIELRSGHYLSSSQQPDNEGDKFLLNNSPFNLSNWIAGLLGLVGISLSGGGNDENSSAMTANGAQSLLYDGVKYSEPYAREANLDLMRARLEADGQLHKIQRQVNNDQPPLTQSQQTEFSNLINLAKMHKNQIVSSGSLGSQVKLVPPVGHFNIIQLVGPQVFEGSAAAAALRPSLLIEPDTSRYKFILSRLAFQRQDVTKMLPLGNDKVMRLRLKRFIVLNHKLMVPEERVALRVVQQLAPQEKQLKRQRDQLVDELKRRIEVYLRMEKDAPEVRRVLIRICDTLLDKMRQLLLVQKDLLLAWAEIESLRMEQKFNSTSMELSTSLVAGKKDEKSCQDYIIKLIQSIDSKFNEKSTKNPFEDVFSKFLQDYESLAGSESSIVIKFNLQPNNQLSASERQRRKLLIDWLKSLRLRILLGEQYFCDQRHLSIDSSFPFLINLDDRTITVPETAFQPDKSLRIQVFRRTRNLVSFTSTLEVETSVELLLDAHKSHQVALAFGDETSLAQLVLESEPGHGQPTALVSENVVQRCKSDLMLNKLHGKVFRTGHNFLDLETKFSMLINKCDLVIPVQTLEPIRMGRKFLVLDPFEDQLERVDSTTGRARGLPAKSSSRQALLLWRWINGVHQTVYLSDRENVKNYSLQMEEFKSKVKELVQQQQQQDFRGHQLIEHRRTSAVDYIREYESQLKELLKYRASQQQVRSSQTTRLREMLSEPEVRLDLSGAARVMRNLMPRPRAHRPLLPKRRAAGKGLHLAVANEPVAPVDAESAAQELDHTHWQRLLAGSSRLQLVVTVQQATNLPMRLVQTTSGGSRPISPRPNSPFVAPHSPSQFMGHHQQPGQYLLAPPTTYVEVVFQRRQQASSLAQGKSPAWNETIFFPVEVAGSGAADGSAQKDQLVDEFLQLNLYDYHCYRIQEEQQLEPLEMSTLAMTSLADQYLDSPIDSEPAMMQRGQQLRSARQRIERHLLGSLRIPLSTLMTNGRIEGSFALKQPLLLENYQFEPDLATLSQELRPSQLPQSATPETMRKRPPPETHISLFITLDPPIAMPIHLLHLPTGGHEPDRVLELARLWEIVVMHHRWRAPDQHLASSFARTRHGLRLRASRHVRALVLQRDAKYCLVSRLLVALKPPAELVAAAADKADKADKAKTLALLARFVSLLSPLKYGLFGMRLLASSLWFDSAQLIEASLGGPEEKAVLLCNYFLYLGLPSALLLGDAVPEGRCVYVICWHEQSRFVNDQLQLQAATLLESISNLAGVSSSANSSRLGEGFSRPLGRPDFVARLPILMNAQSVQLWDPNTGKSFALTGQIPLVSVGSIVTLENVYANIQSTDNPLETNYDIRLKHLWFPLFESGSAADTTSRLTLTRSLGRGSVGPKNIQTSWRRQLIRLETLRKSVERPNIRPLLSTDSALDYGKLTMEECLELKELIERSVKSHLLKWRPDRPTYFNRTLSRLLADKLSLFEESVLAGSEKLDWRSELSAIIKNEVLMAHLSTSTGLNTRQVVSCPLNLPYTSIRTIVDSIFASGVHNADVMLESNQSSTSSSTQFLVACQIHAYPARVLSVWLYVAAIIPNSRALSRLPEGF